MHLVYVVDYVLKYICILNLVSTSLLVYVVDYVLNYMCILNLVSTSFGAGKENVNNLKCNILVRIVSV